MFIVASMTTLMHAATDHAVYIILAFLLVLGGVIGAQFGVEIGSKLRGDQLRLFFAVLIIMIAFQLVITLVHTPANIYSVILTP
jgi:uncharacterized membrane protein YfcA